MDKSQSHKYLPLAKENLTYIVVESSDFDYPWADQEFVDSFEKQLEKYFSKIIGNVVIHGAEFKDCEIFEPNESIIDNFYLKVNKSDLPISKKFIELDNKCYQEDINLEALKKIKSFLIKSESYYLDQYINISNNYLHPFLSVDNGKAIPFLDENILLKHPITFIVGSAGSGKTTLVKKLAYELSCRLEDPKKNKHIVPLFFSLRSINNLNTNLHNEFSTLCRNLNSNYISMNHSKGNLLVILDGLDEINSEKRDEIYDWLKDYTTGKQPVRVIITTRSLNDINYSIVKKFTAITIEPLKKVQIKELATRIFGSKSKADVFYSLVKSNTELVKLLSNPLSLSFTIALYMFKNIFPNDIGALLKELSIFLTETWDEKRKISRYRLTTPKENRILLGKLAYQLQMDSKFTFDSKYFESLLPKYRKYDVENLLLEIKDATNLLTQIDKEWSFSHKYFQEFFCANFLVDKSSGIENDFYSYKNHKNWLNVWNSAIELSSDPEFYFKMEDNNENSAFYNLCRMTSILLDKNNLFFMADEESIHYLILNLKVMDTIVKKIDNKERDVLIEFKENANFSLNDLGSLVTNLYVLNNSNKVNLLSQIENIDSEFFNSITSIIKFKNTPNYLLQGSTIVFHDEV